MQSSASMPAFSMIVLSFAIGMLIVLCAGCGHETDAAAPAVGSSAASDVSGPREAALDGANADSGSSESTGAVAEEPEFRPLTLNSVRETSRAPDAATTTAPMSEEEAVQSTIEKLQPLQVMLGQWRGTTRKDYDGFKAVDSHEWVWDLQTRPEQPGLVMTSDKSPYLRSARLTWDSQTSEYVLMTTDAAGTEHQLRGDFTEAAHEVTGDDGKPQRVYRLEFTEDTAADAAGGELWQLAFAQQENNRYLLEVSRKRGSAAFQRYDTVSTQREGTSFALNDSDYAEKTCIISQGLGTISVSFKGKTYWVCCTGCKAAFEEDPEKWIARAEARDKDKK